MQACFESEELVSTIQASDAVIVVRYWVVGDFLEMCVVIEELELMANRHSSRLAVKQRWLVGRAVGANAGRGTRCFDSAVRLSACYSLQFDEHVIADHLDDSAVFCLDMLQVVSLVGVSGCYCSP